MEDYLHIIFDPSNQIYQILIAAFLGIFIGLRRENSIDAKAKASDIMGIRTTSLFVVVGTVTTFFADLPAVFITILIGMIVLLVIAYANGVFRLGRYGLTSEISALLMFLIGVLVGREQIVLAILLAVLLGISSAYRSHIHTFAQRFSLKEWSGTLQLLVITALILPLLPKSAIDPFGIFVPFDIWMLVILISSISFVGYFFSKYFGQKKSVLAVSFLGSLASSTATTISLAQKSKEKDANPHLLMVGVMISIAVMQLRVLIEIILLTAEFYNEFIAPAFMMMLMAIALAVYYYFQAADDQEDKMQAPKIKSPFEIVPALKFGLFFVFVLYAIHFGKEFFGDVGAYITTFIASFADVDAVIFSTLLPFNSDVGGSVTFVMHVIAIAVIVNTLVKTLYIYFFGNGALFKKAVIGVSIVSLIGIATTVIIG